MAAHIEKGKFGEEVACRLLESKGYKILEVNWHCVHREIDILAQDGEDLVVVEVKTRNHNAILKARECVNSDKMRNLVLAADHYVKGHLPDLNVRFDIIAVETYSDTSYKIEHIKDAFTAPLMGVRSSRSRSYSRKKQR